MTMSNIAKTPNVVKTLDEAEQRLKSVDKSKLKNNTAAAKMKRSTHQK